MAQVPVVKEQQVKLAHLVQLPRALTEVPEEMAEQVCLWDVIRLWVCGYWQCSDIAYCGQFNPVWSGALLHSYCSQTNRFA